MSELVERLNVVLSKSITPFLKKVGFKKSKYSYLSEVNGYCRLVDIQKSRWNDEEELQFTLNCGIYVPGVVSSYANMAEPKNPGLQHCSCSARIGMLTSEKMDIWWKLAKGDPEDNDIKVGEELYDKLVNIAIPFLDRFSEPIEVADFLSTESHEKYSQVAPISEAQRLSYSGIIYLGLGKRREAQEAINMAIEKSKGSPIEGIVAQLAKKLSL